MDYAELMKAALAARAAAYAPYSHFTVGAALLGDDGCIYTGCNIENAAYSPSNCAERTAFFKAVSEGRRDFRAIAVAGAPESVTPESGVTPCGVCRQVMAEFCDPDKFDVIIGRSELDFRVYKLGELLPNAFSGDSLKNK